MIQSNRLPFHEWLIVTLIVCCFLVMTIVTYTKEDLFPSSIKTTHSIISNEITVSICGVIQNPGEYTLKKGATIKELLALAIPLPEANLKGHKTNRKLRQGQKIEILPKPMITVFITGAIENPGPFQVREGTLSKDLEPLLILKPEANLKSFQKKKPLKDQDTIHISQKKI